MKLNENAKTLLAERYLIRDEKGKPTESPEDMFHRVANTIASAETEYGGSPKEWAKKFYAVMEKLEFLPGSPTLLNAGRHFSMLSSCFVLPINDSMKSIFKTIYDMSLVQKAGGGVGYDWSKLRPKGAIVSSSMGRSSGPLSFMKAYNEVTETIKQGGMRKGANMAMLRIDHPDVEEFIVCKRKEGEYTNFNISIAITDEFMDLLERDKEFNLRWPIAGKGEPKIWKTVKAKDLWDKLVENAHSSGDPGIWFVDKTNQMHPIKTIPKKYGECWIASTNPCGEVPLLPYESCNIGSINLAKFVVDGKVDYDGIVRVTRVAVRFLDNVIDCNEYPLTKIEEMTRLNRKIGLGVMGWSDMLQLMKIPYNTQPALDLAEKVISFINDTAHQASTELAEVRDPFPNIRGSVYKDVMMRNATRITLAPTGSISMIAGCCGGIEPYFSNAHLKVVLDGKKFMMKNPTLGGMVEGIDWNEIVSLRGSVQEVKSVPDELKPLFLTALEIDWVWHLKMQASFQKYTDNAVSKTINLPETATVEDVDKIYRMAYQIGCKGVTVFRQGSKKEQVLNVIKPAERPRRLPAEVILVKSGCGKLFITITKMQDDIFEVFANGPGKGGGCASSFVEALCRTISMALRAGVTVETMVNQLRGIRCPEPCMMEGVGIIDSCSDGIGFALQEVMEERNSVVDKGGNCPKCGGAIIHEEGCRKCKKCNWERCG